MADEYLGVAGSLEGEQVRQEVETDHWQLSCDKDTLET